DLSWWWFVGLFLVPDVGLLGFLADNMIGSRAYNTTHTLLGPLVLTGVALSVESEVTLALAAIWLFHCGIDRAFGYGLKYPAGPKETHLQVI
ncbi:MAG: DUF4260 family protein, partial [Nitriliruptoraceae bacterium]